MQGKKVLLVARNHLIIGPLLEQMEQLSVVTHLVQEVGEARVAAAELQPALVLVELDLCHPGEDRCVARQLSRIDGFVVVAVEPNLSVEEIETLSRYDTFSSFLYDYSLLSLRALFATTFRQYNLSNPLRDATSLHRSLQQSTRDGILIYRHGRIVFVNEVMAQLLNAPDPGALLGRTVLDLVHPAYHASFQEIERQVEKVEEASESIEQVLLRLDGSMIYTEVSAAPLMYSGHPAIHLSVRDVDEQVQMQKRLQESEELYRLLVENSADSTLVFDAEGRVLFASSQTIELFGLDAQESLVGRSIWSLFDPKDRPRARKILTGPSPTEPIRNQSFVLRRQNGACFTGEVNQTGLKEAFATSNVRIMNLKDVSWRVKAEERLRRNHTTQTLVSRISRRFIHLPLEEIDQTVQQVLEELSIHLNADAAYLYVINSLDNTFRCTHSWSIPQFDFHLEEKQAIELESFPWLFGHIHTVSQILIEDVEAMPVGAEKEQAQLRQWGVSSALAFPLELEGQVIGLVGVEWARLFPEEHRHCLKDLQVLGSVFSSVLARQKTQQSLWQSKMRLRMIIDAVPHMIYARDAEGRYLFANRAVAQVLGRDIKSLIGQKMSDVCFDLDLARRSLEEDRQILAQQAPTRDVREKLFDCHGRNRVYLTTKIPCEIPGRAPKAILGVSQEITAQARDKERLRQSATVFESTTEGVLITNPQGRIIDVNRAFTEITGYARKDVVNFTPSLLKSGRHQPEFYRELWSSLKTSGTWSGEIWNRKKNGEIYPEWLTIQTVRDEDGRTSHYVGVFSDITAIKESEARLDYLAHHDPLTELPNRLLFGARMGHIIQRAEREKAGFGVLWLDLNSFKKINESIGHAQGDDLLQRVAHRLQSCVRHEDTVARLGGDEFAILLEAVSDGKMAGSVAQKILDTLEQPFDLGAKQVYLTGSVGISLYPQDGDTAEELLRNADTALTRAKKAGHGLYEFYTEELTRQAVERLTLETHLRQALERNELELYYQPQVSLETGELVGLEALMRWNSPALGLMLPGRFIGLAEEIGLIESMGAWAIRQACEQVQTWQQQGLAPVPVAVNVSASQFKEQELLDVVQGALDKTGVSPSLLELEVTESMIMRDVNLSARIMDHFRSCGIGLAVDDFGTGYSSLSYLHQFPIRKLKIDQSFVRGVDRDRQTAAITNSIIDLAGHLGVDVIAEGVEAAEEADFLRERGCQLGQGYCYHQPLPATEVESLLTSIH